MNKMKRNVAATLFLALVVLILDCSALRASTKVETKASAAAIHSSVHLSSSNSIDRQRVAPLTSSLRIRTLEEAVDDGDGDDDYYAEINDDDDFEGSWVEKIYAQDGERYDDDQIHHYTAGTAQNMFDKSPHEWNAWEWVFFVLLLGTFGVFFSCCVMPKCCRRR